uniref:G-protein coupled receptors family 2 profile 1 domain-containing protein n=1 Tax=Sinocyclocheilus rhinocerous TaxID=307959 RepID=A0A673HB12_9TELE
YIQTFLLCVYSKRMPSSSDVTSPYCNRTWDGWLCWDDTPAGTYTSQNCPNYFPDFDSTGTINSFVI